MVLPKLIIEKPFGHDLVSAKELNSLISNYYDEKQIYRIDHYLGKETVQNILFFRFTNGIYEPLWNRRYIDHIEITVAETLGVESRGAYYDNAGAIRDMVQNHILQLLSLVAMEPPMSLDADAIRYEKIKVFNSLRPIRPEETPNFVVRGQYKEGKIGDKVVPSYHDESSVHEKSNTETFIAMKLYINNWRWADVPFYIRTGKRLKRKTSEIIIHFKNVPHALLCNDDTKCLNRNMLIFKIQPEEEISFLFNVKNPGITNKVETVSMDFNYKKTFGMSTSDSYERLILDCIIGDSTLFPRKEGVEASWKFIDMIVKGWEQENKIRIPGYSSGSWGPWESDDLMLKDRNSWKNV